MAPILLIMLATGGRAEAATPEEWAGLYSGRLSAANDWDPTQAITIYETILSSLSTTDPLRGELLYWLGQAHYEAGNHDAARAALLGAAAAPRSPQDPHKMAQTLQRWSNRVRALPTIIQADAHISSSSPWSLVFDLIEEPVQELSVRLLAESTTTIVLADLVSMDGRRIPGTDGLELTPGEWETLTISLRDLRGPSAAGLSTALWRLDLQLNEAAEGTDTVVRIGEVQVR
jgi:hypothetical protein